MAQQLVSPYHLIVWGQHLGRYFISYVVTCRAMGALADAVVLGAARHGLQIGHLTGLVLQGWALVQRGQGEAGIARIQQGLNEYRTRGIGAGLPRYYALLAAAYHHVGEIIAGLATLTEAFSQQHSERADAAESCGCRERSCWPGWAAIIRQKRLSASGGKRRSFSSKRWTRPAAKRRKCWSSSGRR